MITVSEKRFKRGLVVGKFCPLHFGHESVIQRALDDCSTVYVISYSQPELEGCEPYKRRQWLAERFPQVRALVVEGSDDFEVPANDDNAGRHRRFVGRLCRDQLGATVDAVFTSEDYGDGFAQELTTFFREDSADHPEVVHVNVDAGRKKWPVSGTMLRKEIHGHRDYLAPEVYASFVDRVALIGGESSGKTSLAEALAKKFATVWAAEYGRELWEAKGGRLDLGDLSKIARTQISREEEACLRARRFVFCDSTPLTTFFYSGEMFGQVTGDVRNAAGRRYHQTILCAPDFPFVQDGTRRDAQFRKKQHDWYLSELTRRRIQFVEVGGDLDQRVKMVEKLLLRQN